jgi:hypothetical protein
MSAFERLLVPGCTELPVCRCGKEMQIASLDQIPARSDVLVRVYNCRACHHEMRLTVWLPTRWPKGRLNWPLHLIFSKLAARLLPSAKAFFFGSQITKLPER